MQSINLLSAIRNKMSKNSIDVFLIPSNDPHLSEYVANHWKTISYISGFTGSAANIAITKDHAGLWTDSRYFIQAEKELATSPFELHKLLIPHTPEYIEWLIKELPEGACIGVEANLYSIHTCRFLEGKFKPQGIEVKYLKNFLQDIWSDRPKLPNEAIFELELNFAGESRSSKINKICDRISAQGFHWFLANALDDIAWIFNLRGSDVDFNPVFLAYALIGLDETYLFVDRNKLNDELVTKLKEDRIIVKDYDQLTQVLSNLQEKVLLDPKLTTKDLYDSIDADLIVEGSSIAEQLKGCKNEVELENTRKVMIQDGVALLKLYRWLESNYSSSELSEYHIGEKLAAYRAEQEGYYGESFPAITGFKGNGAIVHYRATKEDAASIKGEGMLLLDSGGQYRNGTTDITRTTFFGNPSPEQKRSYTAVLKGNISLDQIHFPKGTKGYQVEVLARQYLWQEGLNYGHGTGHGVGYFLNVHEGPQSISSLAGAKSSVALQPGMITSNEPGFYKEGEYGIRIENLVLVVEDKKTDFGEFLKFETLTMFPISTKLIEFSMLSKSEVQWLNAYHQKVYEKLSPSLNEEEKSWLKEKCKPV